MINRTNEENKLFVRDLFTYIKNCDYNIHVHIYNSYRHNTAQYYFSY